MAVLVPLTFVMRTFCSRSQPFIPELNMHIPDTGYKKLKEDPREIGAEAALQHQSKSADP